jgi:hypothetical protein
MSGRRLSVDSDNPARNKADSFVSNVTHLGNTLKPVANQYPKDPWLMTQLTSSAMTKGSMPREDRRAGIHNPMTGFL